MALLDACLWKQRWRVCASGREQVDSGNYFNHCAADLFESPERLPKHLVTWCQFLLSYSGVCMIQVLLLRTVFLSLRPAHSSFIHSFVQRRFVHGYVLRNVQKFDRELDLRYHRGKYF